jgi:tetratricopeptide (TPR) repeat protein
MSSDQQHRWTVTATGSAGNPADGNPDGALPLLQQVNAHRRLRGPYTAAGTILRALVPQALAETPDLVMAHVIELLSVAPELRASVPATKETLTSLAIPAERTRFYSRLRTLRIAHGLNDFLRTLMTLGGRAPRSLVLEHLDQADPTDQELVAVMLRRMPPELLTLTVCTAEGADLDSSLAAALDRYASRQQPGAAAAPAPAADTDPAAVARAYVDGECLDPDPAARAAYEALPAGARAELHDRRAEELMAAGETSLRLGAVPYHRALGSDPEGAGVEALLGASIWCIENGFYHATMELARRGLDLSIDSEAAAADPVTTWWPLVTKLTMSLSALERGEEALVLYNDARARTTSPRIHMHAAYATSMLYTRHLPPEQRDHKIALGWSNIAIALASQLVETEDQAFSTVFQQNGRALVEGHLGNPEEALALVTNGIERLDRELGETGHGLHRSVLRHNRAQVLKGLGRWEEARQDYEKVIALDPNYAEYHFEYAGLLRRLGEEEQALAEYGTAISLTPPFVELYYNRGDLRAVRGDVDGALADFSYALDLDPEYVDAYVNRASLLLSLGELEAAARDIRAGLELRPDDQHLRCQHARVAWESGDLVAARKGFDQLLLDEPEMAEAWALRAAVRFDDADLEGAAEDLTRALELAETAPVLFNRGAVRESLGRWTEAEADFARAAELDPEDPDTREHLAACRERLAQPASAG